MHILHTARYTYADKENSSKNWQIIKVVIIFIILMTYVSVK